MTRTILTILILVILAPADAFAGKIVCLSVIADPKDVETARVPARTRSGSMVLTGSQGGQVSLVNSSTGGTRRLLALPSSVTALDLSADSKLFAAGFKDGSLVVADINTGRQLLADLNLEAPIDQPITAVFFLEGTDNQIVTVSADGRLTQTNFSTGESRELLILNVSLKNIESAKLDLFYRGFWGGEFGYEARPKNARLIVRSDDLFIVLLIASAFPHIEVTKIVEAYAAQLRGHAEDLRKYVRIGEDRYRVPGFGELRVYLDLPLEFKIEALRSEKRTFFEDLGVTESQFRSSKEGEVIAILQALQLLQSAHL